MARPRRQTIRIYLKHHNNPRMGSWTKVCSTYEQRREVNGRFATTTIIGCGATLIGYRTWPNEKPMYFDGPPVVKEQYPVRQDGAVIADVYTDNVHWSTCPNRQRPAAAHDGRALAAGQ